MLKELLRFLPKEIIVEIVRQSLNEKVICITGEKQATGKSSVARILRENNIKCYELWELTNYDGELRREIFEVNFDNI